jgi:hypothetical protein
VKTIVGLCAVIFFLGVPVAEAQTQQNMGTPRKGTGMGQVPPSFYTPGTPRGFVTGPKATLGSPPPQWSTGARRQTTARKTR